jgi:hypothetical protein
MARHRSRARPRPLRERLSLRTVHEALGSLSGSGSASGLGRNYRTGLRLSQDLLNLALILLGVRFALTGAFITVISSHVLFVLLFNLLVTLPAMYRTLRRLGWVDGPAIGPSLVLAGVRRAGSAVSGALTPSGSSTGRSRSSTGRFRSSTRSRSRSAGRRSLGRRATAYLAGLSLPSVRSLLPDGGSSDRL